MLSKVRWPFWVLIALALSLSLFGFASAESPYQGKAVCNPTPFLSESDIPGHISTSTTPTWFGTDALAAALTPAYYGEWYAGEPGIQVIWWRGTPGELEIEGARLDGPAEALIVNAPRGYLDADSYESTGLLFPSPGCWEITGRVEDTVVSFTVWVNPADEHPIHGRTDDRCPITPHLPFHSVTSYASAPAGEFPVWLTIGERYGFERTRSLPPFEGIYGKFLIFVDKRAEGQLNITGKQLDGDGVVLFPEGGQIVSDENGPLGALFDEAFDARVVEDAQITTIIKPPDSPVAEHAAVLIFPNPGCYEITATLTGSEETLTVRIVSEVVGG